MAVQHVQPEEITRLWERVLSSVQSRLESLQAFDTWFKPIVPREISPQFVDLEVPNTFFVDWIHEHHLATLRQSLADILGHPPEVRFHPSEAVTRPAVATTREAGRPDRRRRSEHSASPRRRTAHLPADAFETFVVGNGNRFTHAACVAVAENPAWSTTHCSSSADPGSEKRTCFTRSDTRYETRVPDIRVFYVSAERFTNEMIYGIQHASDARVPKQVPRNVDVLLIDDIQFLAGKESTQEEFFHTFNALRDAHKQIVVHRGQASQGHPMLEERLTSRFNQGLIADVKQPDLETRIAILRNRCDQEGDGTRLPDDVLLFIADRIRNNIRDLEGCLVRSGRGRLADPSRHHAGARGEVLQQYVNPEPDQMTPGASSPRSRSGSRPRPKRCTATVWTRNVALPRQVAMYLMRQLTDLSLVEIGRIFGGRDHTTVIYACEKVAGMLTSVYPVCSAQLERTHFHARLGVTRGKPWRSGDGWKPG